jgi:hypothetical protein
VNATSVRFEGAGIGDSTARRVTFTPVAEQKCKAVYSTEGNITAPAVVGWVVSYSATRTWFAHEFIREDSANVAVAGMVEPAPIGEFPRFVQGRSTSTITVQPDEEMTYYVATNYQAHPVGDAGGKFSFQLYCSGGIKDVKTGWSTTAYLLSDLSMEGTRASVSMDVDGQPARWEATPDAHWSASLPLNETTFLATEPLMGKAVLTTTSGIFACGPSTNQQAVSGAALCLDDYRGGDTGLQLNQLAPGGAANSGTSDSWMALVAQFDSHSWAASGGSAVAV